MPPFTGTRDPIPAGSVSESDLDFSPATDQEVADAIAGLSGTYAPLDLGVSAAQPLMAKLKRNLDADASIVVVGDSTGDASTEWVRLLCDSLAAAFPAWTVTYRTFDDTGAAWNAPTTVQAGSGARTLAVSNASVSGWNAHHVLRRLETVLTAVQPDLVFVSIGHNETEASTTNFPVSAKDYRERMLALTESIRARCPASSLMLVAQNPGTADNSQAARAKALYDIAGLRGYGLVDVHQAFVDYGNWSADLLTDTVHPNAAGQAVWAAEVMTKLRYLPGVIPPAQEPSAFLGGRENLLVNGDFALFDGSVPDGWSLTNATAVKDTTNFENPVGWACRVQSTGASASSIFQDLPLAMCKGQWITVAARVRRNGGGSSNHGRINIQESGGGSKSLTSRASSIIADAYYWVVLSNWIDPSATSVRVRCYGDSSTGGAGDVSFDRVIAVRGLIPSDLPGVLLDAELRAIAETTSAANKVPMFSGSGTATLLDFKDEDNMASDSATAVPSQQSVKAYADALVAASVEAIQDIVGPFLADSADLDFTYDDAGNAVGAVIKSAVLSAFGRTLIDDTTPAAARNTLGFFSVVKAADETVSASTTLQNDDELLIPVEASTTYIFEAVLFYDGATTGDIKVAFSVPAGATIEWTTIRAASSLAANNYAAQIDVVTGGSSVTSGANGAGNHIAYRCRGTVVVGGTAGNLQLQWAQAVSDPTASTVFAKSFLTAQKVG